MFEEMQNLPKKDGNQTTAQLAHQFRSIELPKHSLCKNVASGLELEAEAYCHGKDSESKSQEQDSSSTLSTCQSHHAVPSMSRNKSRMENVVSEPGCNEPYGRTAESCLKSCSPCENADYEMHGAQLAFKQSMACISLPWTESYYGGIIAAYGPNAIIYPQMLGMTPARVPLPLECAERFPIYVNAKQYGAILRRRKIRAKLEAQNKQAASRKPYLHESRHLHAIRRARGSGGRFLKAKTIQHSRPSSPTYVNYKSHQQLGVNVSHSEFQHSRSGSWETSTPSISDVTSIFSGRDDFQHREFNLPSSPFHFGATMPVEQGFTHGRT